MLLSTHTNWLSMANLNCISPSPTSVIFKSLPIFHTDLKRFFAALRFIGLVVRNLPNRLKEHSSNICLRCSERTCMTSPSSGIKLTRLNHSMKSESMLSKYNIGAALMERISSESVYLCPKKE